MSKSKKLIFFFILLILLVSCTNDKDEQIVSSLTIEDALGRTVEFENEPERIVIGGNGALMIVDALLAFPEGKERLVAYTQTDQGKGSFTTALLPEGNAETIVDRTSVETIASYQPDVVLLKTYMKDLGDTLGQLSIPVIYLNLETYEQYQQDMQNLGLLLGNVERSNELLNYYASIVSRVEQNSQELKDEEKPTVLFVNYDTKDGAVAVKVPPIEWAQTILIQRAGGVPVWSDIELASKWTVISFEQIAAWNPDIILLTSYFENVDDVKSALLADSRWQQLDAVQNNHLFAYPMAFYSWDQPHTRWGLVQLWIGKTLFPELYSDLDFHQEAVSFYQQFYGWDETKFDEVILPRLQGDIP